MFNVKHYLAYWNTSGIPRVHLCEAAYCYCCI